MLTNSLQKDMAALDFFKAKGINIQYLDPEIQKSLHAKALDLLDKKAANDPFFKRAYEAQKKFRSSYNTYKVLMTPQFE